MSLMSADSLYASDDWLCKTQSSQKRGNSIVTCGIGTDKSEAQARIKAFVAAQDEFNLVCNASEDCKDRKINVMPERTDCVKNGEIHKCYRAVNFDIEVVAVKEKKDPLGFLITHMGQPDNVKDIEDYLEGKEIKQVFFSGPVCVFSRCYVIVEDGKVTKYSDVRQNFVNIIDNYL